MLDKAPSAQPQWLAQKQKISVREAAKLNDISEDSFRRHHSDLIKQVSPRRQAVELHDALNVGTGKQPPT